jgi:hypothetical protein
MTTSVNFSSTMRRSASSPHVRTGTIVYMNRALRAVLGLGDDPALLRVKDIVKEDPSRLLRRDRRGFGPSRAHDAARDGRPRNASSALSFWPSGRCRRHVADVRVLLAEAEAPGCRRLRPVRRGRADGVFAQRAVWRCGAGWHRSGRRRRCSIPTRR